MPPDLQQIINELKKENCPQRIRDQVRGRISARANSSHRLSLVIRLATACLVLASSVAVWQWRVRENAQKEAIRVQLEQRAQVVHEAEDALGLVGSVLLDAGAQSRKIISAQTVPPLQASFELTKNKITQHINL